MTGKEIRELREKLGMRQIDLAVALDCATATISGWENGKYKIRPVYENALRRLAKDRGYDV